jgi:hypothetical protein
MIGRPPSHSASESSDEGEEKEEGDESDYDEEDMLLPGLDMHAGSRSRNHMRSSHHDDNTEEGDGGGGSRSPSSVRVNMTDGFSSTTMHYRPNGNAGIQTPECTFYEPWRHACSEGDVTRWGPPR